MSGFKETKWQAEWLKLTQWMKCVWENEWQMNEYEMVFPNEIKKMSMLHNANGDFLLNENENTRNQRKESDVRGEEMWIERNN